MPWDVSSASRVVSVLLALGADVSASTLEESRQGAGRAVAGMWSRVAGEHGKWYGTDGWEVESCHYDETRGYIPLGGSHLCTPPHSQHGACVNDKMEISSCSNDT